MHTESSTVNAVVREIAGNIALVEVEQGGCGRCHEKGGCGGQHLTQMFCTEPKRYRVENEIGAQPGERVSVAIAAGAIRKSANLAYLLPLVATIAGAVIGTAFAGNEGGMLGALLGILLAFFYVRSAVARSAGNWGLRPQIVSRLSSLNSGGSH